MERIATCSCGALRMTCSGDPVRISVCHCRECQRRTGSVFGAQIWFERDCVRLEGAAKTFSRQGDSGATIDFSFCPVCGSTLTWRQEARPDLVAIALGGFAGEDFGPPDVSVYDSRRRPWVEIACSSPVND
jgi:hypothetical protein